MNFLEKNKKNSLSQNFRLFAKQNGKVAGSIRNLYYAIVKLSNNDKDFCETFLNGKPLKAEEIINFTSEQEKKLIKSIIIGRSNNKSVRKIVNELADNDSKKSLRLQNKYRNIVKCRPEFISICLDELRKEGYDIDSSILSKCSVNRVQFLRLKQEIDGLVDRLSTSIKKENELLKQQLCMLKTENYRLKKEMEENYKCSVKDYFKRDEEVKSKV